MFSRKITSRKVEIRNYHGHCILKCDLHLVIKYQKDLWQCQHESENNDDNTEAVEDEGYGKFLVDPSTREVVSLITSLVQGFSFATAIRNRPHRICTQACEG